MEKREQGLDKTVAQVEGSKVSLRILQKSVWGRAATSPRFLLLG
jgi:hypothetical protein